MGFSSAPARSEIPMWLLSASTPAEGRAIVDRYADLGFEQMKLYSVLAANVVGAITDEAHKRGMTVTGHIPTSLTVNSAIDSGMDQIAHLPLRGSPTSDTLRETIAHLKARNIVVDPTASWGEIGGHSTAEPLENFQPVTRHLPATFLQTRAAGWGVDVDTATAHATRIIRSTPARSSSSLIRSLLPRAARSISLDRHRPLTDC